jgi:Methyltransferase domain
MNERLHLDFDNVLTAEERICLSGALPFHVQTPSGCWSHGLSIPIVVDQPAPAIRTRIALRLAAIHGSIRIGVLTPDRSDYIVAHILGTSSGTANIELPLIVSGTPGPLVAQNLSTEGASSFTLIDIDVLDGPSYPTERDAQLAGYMRNGFNAIEGWCHYLNIAFLRAMDEVLFAHDVDGGIAEIGVHHGKQFIALHNLMRSGAMSVAIDVFGQQRFNLDRSGSGDREKFQGNLAAWGVRPENCLVVERDSLSLSSRDLDELHGRVGSAKYFGVDGCHEVEHTISDIRAAMNLLAHGGVLILDDYLNPDFPGVHQAVAHLFINDRPGIAPFLLGQNKLYLTQVSHVADYLAAARLIIANIPETATVQEVNLYGYKALSWRSAEASWAYPGAV